MKTPKPLKPLRQRQFNFGIGTTEFPWLIEPTINSTMDLHANYPINNQENKEENLSEPIIDYENDTIDFGDGDLVDYWWEDMRPREVMDTILDVYKRGLRDGKKGIK